MMQSYVPAVTTRGTTGQQISLSPSTLMHLSIVPSSSGFKKDTLGRCCEKKAGEKKATIHEKGHLREEGSYLWSDI
jgi:hypothetical protein